MSERKYKCGKQITSIKHFEDSQSDWFIVYFGITPRTKHRAFLISWQYRVLQNFIYSGRVFEADKIEVEND